MVVVVVGGVVGDRPNDKSDVIFHSHAARCQAACRLINKQFEHEESHP